MGGVLNSLTFPVSHGHSVVRVTGMITKQSLNSNIGPGSTAMREKAVRSTSDRMTLLSPLSPQCYGATLRIHTVKPPPPPGTHGTRLYSLKGRLVEVPSLFKLLVYDKALSKKSFTSWRFGLCSHPGYDIFVGSESRRIGIFGKTEETEIGLKMTRQNSKGRHCIWENLEQHRGGGEGDGGSIQVQKPLKSSGSQWAIKAIEKYFRGFLKDG